MRESSPESRVALAFNCEYPQHSTGAFATPSFTQRTLKMWDGWERGHRGRLTTEVAHGDADTYFRHARRVKKRVVALLASGDPYMKLWEMQNALLAAMQIGSAHNTSLWLTAGISTAELAVLAAHEGDYAADAAAVLFAAFCSERLELGFLSPMKLEWHSAAQHVAGDMNVSCGARRSTPSPTRI